MASIRKVGDSFKAEVARKGVRKSQTFKTKTEAKNWAARQEYLILNEDEVQSKVTFGEVMARYAEEVSPTKRGGRWERMRLAKFQADEIGGVALADLRGADFSSWRDTRLKAVSQGSVHREMILMSAVLTQARKEWGLIKANPMGDVKKPGNPPPRNRRPSVEELEKLLHSAGEDLTKRTARAYHAFLFGIETGMRAGEVMSLTWDRVDLVKRVAHLPLTKNGTARDVALTTRAVQLLEALPRMETVFGLTSVQLDVLWRKLRTRAGVTGLTFHDSRHEAITRLAKKLDVLSLARMVGHRNLNQLNAYYNETAEELARRLD